MPLPPPPPTGQRRLDRVALADLTPATRNPKEHDLPGIRRSISRFGFADTIAVDERTGRVLAGHGRLEALTGMFEAGEHPPDGIEDGNGEGWLVPVLRGWASKSDAEADALLVALNEWTTRGGWDTRLLSEMLEEFRDDDLDLLAATGYTPDDLDAMLASFTTPDEPGGLPPVEDRPTLADRFLIPPFDVLDARQGWWKERKRQWLALGIRSEIGRGHALLPSGANSAYGNFGPNAVNPDSKEGTARALIFRSRSGREPDFYYRKTQAERRLGRSLTVPEFEAIEPQTQPAGASGISFGGTSVFDPVLCELAYRWFSAPGSAVLDPFAGGSVRGIVASILGRSYRGNDLSADQIEANREQAATILPALGSDGPVPEWSAGDSADWVQTLEPESADMIFTCPPYLWLERYSKDPADLSNMTADDFETVYTRIVDGAARALRPDRFAVFVVGDARSPKTHRLHDFRGMTVRAAEHAGMQLHSAAVMVTPAASLAVRAPYAFERTRVLGRCHQYVLLFVKGSGKAAATWCGPVTVEIPEGFEAENDEDASLPDEGDFEPDPPDTDNTPEHTPIEEHGGYLVKRDDLFRVAGQNGGKVRTCWHLAQGATGLVTASSRQSPQAMIVAHIAQRLGIPARLHMPSGEDTPEMAACRAAGAEIIQHKPGYNTVIVARAKADAHEQGWTEIPFGMECAEAVRQTATQVANLPPDTKRIVVPVGSGMSLAGIVAGLQQTGRDTPVLGVQVGADPTKRLNRYAPGWRKHATLTKSNLDYHARAPKRHLGALLLDPIYEAKCLPHLADGDLLWAVGIRATGQ